LDGSAHYFFFFAFTVRGFTPSGDAGETFTVAEGKASSKARRRLFRSHNGGLRRPLCAGEWRLVSGLCAFCRNITTRDRTWFSPGAASRCRRFSLFTSS